MGLRDFTRSAQAQVAAIYAAVITTIPATLATLATSVAVAAIKTVVDALAVSIGAYNDTAKASGVSGSLWAHLTHVQDSLAAAAADLGDASASTLGSILAILGNPSTALSTTLATIAGDVVETAAGRPQTATYTNATLATDAGRISAKTVTAQPCWLHRVAEECAAAGHANTVLQVEVYRGDPAGAGTLRKTLIDAARGAAGAFSGAGVPVAWEDEAIYLAVGDRIVVNASGAAGGTNAYTLAICITAAVDGGYLA